MFDIKETVRRTAGAKKPFFWRYTSKTIAIPLIKCIKKNSGINHFRKNSMDLKKGISDIQKTRREYLKLVLLGANSNSGLNEVEKKILEEISNSGDIVLLETLNICKGLANKYKADLENYRANSIRYELGEIFKKSGLEKSRSFVYFPGNVFYINEGLREEFGNKINDLEKIFCDDNNLDIELFRGNRTSRKYSEGTFVFSPIKTYKGRTAAIAYFSPERIKKGMFNGSKRSRRLDIIIEGRETLKLVGNYLKGCDLGLIGTHNGKR